MGKDKLEDVERPYKFRNSKYNRKNRPQTITKKGRQLLDEVIEKKLKSGHKPVDIVTELSTGSTKIADRKTVYKHIRIIQDRLRKVAELEMTEKVRLPAKQDAFREHTRHLCVLVQQWYDQLDVPLIQILDLSPELKGDYNPAFHFVQTSNGKVEIELSVEKKPLFPSLKEHLPDSPIWDLFQQWKSAIMKLSYSLEELCVLIKGQQLLASEVWLTEEDWSRGRTGLLSQFTKTMVADTCEVAILGSSSWRQQYGFKKHPKQDNVDILILDWISGSYTLAVGIGITTLERYRDLHLDLRKWLPQQPQITDFVEHYRQVTIARENLRSELIHIQLKGTFSGQCAFCRD